VRGATELVQGQSSQQVRFPKSIHNAPEKRLFSSAHPGAHRVAFIVISWVPAATAAGTGPEDIQQQRPPGLPSRSNNEAHCQTVCRQCVFPVGTRASERKSTGSGRLHLSAIAWSNVLCSGRDPRGRGSKQTHVLPQPWWQSTIRPRSLDQGLQSLGTRMAPEGTPPHSADPDS
jgi:hypothetical protein